MTLNEFSPDDYAWSEWIKSGVNADNGYLELNDGQDTGYAESPAMGHLDSEDDHSDWTSIIKIAWRGLRLDGVSAQYKVSDTSSGLASASYSTATNNEDLASANQKKFCQLKLTFTRDSNGLSPTIVGVSVIAQYLDYTGMNQFLKNSGPTRDGKFKGQKMTCDLTGLTGRKHEMKKQKRVRIILTETNNFVLSVGRAKDF